jgi:O-antigen/teichoic acid export membrane protein
MYSQSTLNQQSRLAGVPIRFQRLGPIIGPTFRFALPTFLATAMTGPVTWIANAMLIRQPNGYAEMGIYNAVEQWRTAIVFLPAMISSVTLPMLSSLHSSSERAKYTKLLSYSVLLTTAASLVVAVPLLLCSRFIMALYGEAFLRGSTALMVMSLASVLIAVGSTVSSAIVSVGAVWFGFFTNLIWACTFLTLTHFLVESGARGLALAYLLSYFLHSLSAFAYAWRTVQTGSQQAQCKHTIDPEYDLVDPSPQTHSAIT